MAKSIINRGKNTWRLEVKINDVFSGKVQRYTKTFHGGKRDANNALNEFYNECLNKQIQPGTKLNVEQLFSLYYQNHVMRNLKYNSQRTAVINSKKIIEVLGEQKANKITRFHIQRFIDELAKDRAPKTVRNYLMTLNGMFKYAVEEGWIVNNPCQNIRLPRLNKKESPFYTADEVQKLLSLLDSLPDEELLYKTAIYILLFAGLRRGELLGLNWEDVDMDDCILHIRRNRIRNVGGGVLESSLKTEKAERDISIPFEIINLLKQLKTVQKENRLKYGPLYKDSHAVFQSPLGQPIHTDSLLHWYQRFCKKYDFRYIHLHGLRHTHISMLADIPDLTPTQISQRAGHSQTSTTLNIYTHLFKNNDKIITDKLSDIINSK